MDKKIYNSLIENSSFNVKTWQRISGGLLISNLLLVTFLVFSDRSQKIIVVPPELKGEVWIKGNEVSPMYVEQMANYFFQLLLTYNKQNISEQYQSILHYVTPLKYGDMKSFLLADIDRVKRNELASVFYPMSIKVNGMRAEMEGEHLGIVGEKIITRKLKKYQMVFSYKNGGLKIESYSEINKQEEQTSAGANNN